LIAAHFARGSPRLVFYVSPRIEQPATLPLVAGTVCHFDNYRTVLRAPRSLDLMMMQQGDAAADQGERESPRCGFPSCVGLRSPG